MTSPVQPSCAARSRERLGRAARRASPVRAQRERRRGQLAVPGGQRRLRGAARRGCARAARCAGPARASTRCAVCRPQPATARPRPGRGGRGAAPGGPLNSSSRSGRNTLTSGLQLDVEQALDGGAVGGHPLDRLAAAGDRAEADGSARARSLAVEQPDDDARRLRRRSAPARARCGSAASGRCSRSTAPRAGCDLPAPLGPWTTRQARRRGRPRRGRRCGSRAAAR